MKTRQLQQWLNDRGASLTVDGKWGRNTRAAFIEVFRNTDAPAANKADMLLIAEGLGCTPRQIKAVAKVEGGNSGWDDKGRLKCLYERHYAWRRVRIRVPMLSNPRGGGYSNDANRNGINDSWEKLADATGRWGVNIALECASFGKFQIMGAHWKALGYEGPLDFVWKLSRDEAAHYDAFARFIRVNRLVAPLRQINGSPVNSRKFARGYNGSGFAKHGYHFKIANAWKALR